jgi:hypothetical protein
MTSNTRSRIRMVGLTEFIAPCGRNETTDPRQVRGILLLGPSSCRTPSISSVPPWTSSGARAVSDRIEPSVVLPQPDSPATPRTSPSSMWTVTSSTAVTSPPSGVM